MGQGACTIQSINVVSAMKVCTILYFFFGVLAGLLVFGFSGIYGMAMRQAGASGGGPPGGFPGFGFAMGAVGLIVYPLLYAVIGAIGGAIGALLYNLVARWVGGLEIELG